MGRRDDVEGGRLTVRSSSRAIAPIRLRGGRARYNLGRRLKAIVGRWVEGVVIVGAEEALSL